MASGPISMDTSAPSSTARPRPPRYNRNTPYRPNNAAKRSPRKKFVIDRLSADFKNNYKKLINEFRDVFPGVIIQNANYTLHKGIYFEVFDPKQWAILEGRLGALPPNKFGGNARLRLAGEPISERSKIEIETNKKIIVVKSLCRAITDDDLKSALTEANVNFTDLHWMTPDSQKYGLLKLTLSSADDAENLCRNGIMFACQKLYCVPYYQAPRPIQCHKCWSFGHHAEDCPNLDICKKCGLQHRYSECPIKGKNAPNCKCPNCGGNHSASWAGCPKYQAASQTFGKPPTSRPPPRTATRRAIHDAPPPKTNAWFARPDNPRPSSEPATTAVNEVVQAEIAKITIDNIRANFNLAKVTVEQLDEDEKKLLADTTVSHELIRLIFFNLRTLAKVQRVFANRPGLKRPMNADSGEGSARKQAAPNNGSWQFKEPPTLVPGNPRERRNSFTDNSVNS